MNRSGTAESNDRPVERRGLTPARHQLIMPLHVGREVEGDPLALDPVQRPVHDIVGRIRRNPRAPSMRSRASGASPPCRIVGHGCWRR